MTDDLKKLVGEKVGEATMCWSPIPDGVFESERAAKILEDIYAAINAELVPNKL